MLLLHTREYSGGARRRQRLEQHKRRFVQLWTSGAEWRSAHHRGAAGVLGDGEELVGASIVVGGQQHSILCWVVADAPEAAACATPSFQAQAM